MDISLAQPIITEEMREEVDRVLREEYYVNGNSVRTFEKEFADYVGTDHAVAVDSGTRALHLALKTVGIEEGDRVLTTPATFIATANAIRHAGAEVRFVDVDLDTYTIDTVAVKQVLDEEPIDAVVPVHLYGYPVAIPELRDVNPDIPIIADACQAHGARLQGTSVGALSTLSCFSFYPSKNMTVAGDGGMITTDDGDAASLLRSLRDVGRSGDKSRDEHTLLGYTARLNTVNAAVGKQQLEHLEKWNEKRREIAAIYTDQLSGIGDLILPPTGSQDRTLAWYLYVVRTNHRDELRSYLADHGIETGIHYSTPVHRQPPYQELGYDVGAFPAAEKWAETVLSLPIHPGLSESDIERAIKAITEFFEQKL